MSTIGKAEESGGGGRGERQGVIVKKTVVW